MRKLLLVLVYSLSFFITSNIAYARLSGSATVSASVGEYYLNLSGFVSPYASVVLTSDGVFMRATVADSQGNFFISQVLIKDGFSHFCLQAVDFKKIGESLTCINIPPAHASVTKSKIFLPPTLGLSKTTVAQGEEVLAFGYTMPGAEVKLNLGNGKTLTVLADSTGYYVFTLKNLPAGKYSLFATAVYKGQESLSPSKKLELTSLSLWERIIAFIKDILNKIFTFITSSLLWLSVPIIILIIILIHKIWPGMFTSLLPKALPMIGEGSQKHHLHHYWLVGE